MQSIKKFTLFFIFSECIEQSPSVEDQLSNLLCIGSSDIQVQRDPSNTSNPKVKEIDRQKLCKREGNKLTSTRRPLTRQKASNNKNYDQNLQIYSYRDDDTRDHTPENLIQYNYNNKDNHEKTEFLHKDQLKNEDPQKNQLTEKVLQWLDKTGKFTRGQTEKANFRMGTLPEISIKEPDVEEDEKKVFAKKVLSAENVLRPRSKYTVPPLRRSESVHTLSLTFDDDGHVPDPYNGSRCKSAAVKFGDLFPTTYKCSKKFLSLCSRKNSASSGSQNSLKTGKSTSQSEINSMKMTNNNEQREETNNSNVISLNNLSLNQSNQAQNNPGMETSNSNPGTSNKKSNRKILRRKDTLIENQYKHIIHKHILETQCNTQIVKRQLHIFIPKLRKKDTEMGQVTTGIGTGGDQNHLKVPDSTIECDSCLSTVYSEVN